MRSLDAAAAAGLAEDNSDDDEWEDEPGLFDLARSGVKQGKSDVHVSLPISLVTVSQFRPILKINNVQI